MTSLLDIVCKYSETGHSDLFEIEEIKKKANSYIRLFNEYDCTFLTTLIAEKTI